MGDNFQFADDLGPEKILHIYEPSVGLKAIAVVDNVACGPSIGGIRMAPDVSTEEVFRLARAMTLKNAAAGLPHGGGKSAILADPELPLEEKEPLVRAFANAIRSIEGYIPGPDMGTNETCMAWVYDEIGRVIGLPREVGGIPLDEIGATGFGLACAVDVAAEHCDLALDGARVAIQGFGAVGSHAARFLAKRGTVLVAAADYYGMIYDPDGLDVERLFRFMQHNRSVVDFPDGETHDRDEIIGVECEIWVPAARPDVIDADNVDQLRTKLIAQGANIPVTEEAEAMLHTRGVLSLPDFIANAGGVICAAVEYAGGSESAAFATIEEKIKRNTRAVLERSAETGEMPLHAAHALAERRVRAAMAYRRFS